MYTTVDQTPNLDPDFNKSDFKAPMAGFGYGLPISRLYARYFGGDLKLISMEGYGTDVYLHLNRLSSSSEPLHQGSRTLLASDTGLEQEAEVEFIPAPGWRDGLDGHELIRDSIAGETQRSLGEKASWRCRDTG
ncbi:pyruvate dehydrogenase kinase [Trichophyton tonsurans CBS 112818]|uniref:Protein-serine/threonine kinase n=1 Tax=Trichophyton tonsurans (strain CBS 112818) TaxID=647933 RepID=F2SBI1_TRIT1|nr:pyruvate dehydrogenase kinase [Trichophyton tonsurans CBS 112818]